MTKAKTKTGKASTKMAPGKRQGVPAKNAGTATTAKRSTAKSSTAKRSTSASRQSASGVARSSKANQEGRPGAGPAPLRPIRQRQTRNQILATVATASGVDRPIVERVARSLSQTVQRHLIRNGSGRVEIPYLGGVIYRGRQAAQKARTMLSPILGNREVQVPARRAQSVPRFKAHPTLRRIVART